MKSHPLSTASRQGAETGSVKAQESRSQGCSPPNPAICSPPNPATVVGFFCHFLPKASQGGQLERQVQKEPFWGVPQSPGPQWQPDHHSAFSVFAPSVAHSLTPGLNFLGNSLPPLVAQVRLRGTKDRAQEGVSGRCLHRTLRTEARGDQGPRPPAPSVALSLGPEAPQRLGCRKRHRRHVPSPSLEGALAPSLSTGCIHTPMRGPPSSLPGARLLPLALARSQAWLCFENSGRDNMIFLLQKKQQQQEGVGLQLFLFPG